MSTTEDRGKLLEDETRTTPDGQRVIEVYENEVDDPDGNPITLTRSYERGASLKEQVEYVANDIAEQAMKMVTHANSATVESGGSDEAPTVTITLSASKAAAAPPAAAPAKPSSKASAPSSS